jgi:hypothetical protein
MERQTTSAKREAPGRINDLSYTAGDSDPGSPSDNDGTESTATATTQETANLSRLATSSQLSHHEGGDQLAGGETHSLSQSHSPLKPIAPDSPTSREVSQEEAGDSSLYTITYVLLSFSPTPGRMRGIAILCSAILSLFVSYMSVIQLVRQLETTPRQILSIG